LLTNGTVREARGFASDEELPAQRELHVQQAHADAGRGA
jgi:hypothetical protein